jgi:fumarate reductase subunit C
MQRIIFILLVVVTLGASPSRAKAWFGDEEKQRRIETEQKLVQQQQATNQWQITAFLLGVGCVLVLVAGTAIGSKARRDAKRN